MNGTFPPPTPDYGVVPRPFLLGIAYLEYSKLKTTTTTLQHVGIEPKPFIPENEALTNSAISYMFSI